MPVTDAALIARTPNCSLVAPAGFGKTHLIAEAVALYNTGRELILTHTHSGIHSLRKKLRTLNSDPKRYCVETIAGFSLRLSSAYSGLSEIINVQPKNNADYTDVYQSAVRLLEKRNIRDVLIASYSGVYVDEYQDCTLEQHRLVLKLKEILPVRLLGDPLQGIFSFRNNTCVDWNSDVVDNFTSLDELSTPWRWQEANRDLGDWLIEVRNRILTGQEIEFNNPPINWHQLPVSIVDVATLRSHLCNNLANNGNNTIVVIRKWKGECHDFGKHIGSRYGCVEAIESDDLSSAAGAIQDCTGPSRSKELIKFVSECKTQVKSDLGNVYRCFEQDNIPQMSRCRVNREAVQSLVDVAQSDDLSKVIIALEQLRKMPGNLFRRELFYEFTRGVEEYVSGGHATLNDAVWHSRNRTRQYGRRIDRRTIGTTLLVKGLEFDDCLVWNAETLGDSKNLYVALTRGSRSLTVVSNSTRISFK